MDTTTKDYSATNMVVFTLQCHEGKLERFRDLYNEIERYATIHKKTVPKRNELFSKVLEVGMDNITPENFVK